MNTHILQAKKRHHRKASTLRFWLVIRNSLPKSFHKNIYTQILFSNMTVFVFSFIVFMMFSNFVMKQVIYSQFQQELLRKANLVNFVLLRLKVKEAPAALMAPTTPVGPLDNFEQARKNTESVRKEWEKARILFKAGVISKVDYENAKVAYQRFEAYQRSNQNRGKQSLLKFLADLFNARKITVFNKTGNIVDAYGEHNVTSVRAVERKFIELLGKGEIAMTRSVDRQSGRSTFIAMIPLWNEDNTIENGVMLEMNPPKLDFALNKMYLYIVIGGIILLIVVIFNSIYLSMYISRPISRLAADVSEISRGLNSIKVEEQCLDEINILAGQFNILAAELQKIKTENCRMEEEQARLFMEVSHELRTPLTSVQGFVEAIRDGMVQDQALLERYLDTIYAQTVHIARLVDDMLVLGRLESGNMTIEKQPLDMIILTQNVMTSFEAEAMSRNTLLLLDKKTEKAIVIGDVDRMEQIIRNLLKNAIKATENGSINVSVDSQCQDEMVLTIQDNGIGIAEGDLPRIWDRFYRGKNQGRNRLQEKGSSGLGLVIVKKLVQLQDGTITVESQLGKGTTFTISFPSFNPPS